MDAVRRPRDCVQTPDYGPWIPPAPPLALDTPLVLPDLATLMRFRDALRTHRPKSTPRGASHGTTGTRSPTSTGNSRGRRTASEEQV